MQNLHGGGSFLFKRSPASFAAALTISCASLESGIRK
jgi:hypothetical protein